MKNIDAKTLKQWMDDGQVFLVDVREPAEHAAQKIMGSHLHPLSKICCKALPKTSKKMVVHCQKGARGTNACLKLESENSDLELYHLEGGIEAWQAAGFGVESSGNKVLPLDRQVQLVIGLCVLMGSLLGYFVNINFIWLAAFFGAGLTFAALTGFCGLAFVVAKMPWNR